MIARALARAVRSFAGGRALRACAAGVLLAGTPLLSQSAWSQAQQCDPDTDPNCPTPLSRSLDAIKAYFTAPLHWTATDWLYVGGAVAAIGIAHEFDGRVRTHFTGNSPSALNSTNTHDLQDALPAAALFVGTLGYANLIDNDNGRREARTMIESAVLSVGTAYVLKYAAGRQRPDQTTDPNRWWASGGSFPSVHATAAFAIGTVLAESGNDEYRWARRLLGYGVAGFTAYERLGHNAHWLSDTVAGAALGAASARFAMNRSRNPEQTSSIGLAPLNNGVLLSYTAQLH